MEPAKFLKVKAALEICSHSDVSSRGKLLEHRMFFVADEISKELKETWTINNTSSYEKMCLSMTIARRRLFKIADAISSTSIVYWIVLSLAEPYDCMYAKHSLKINTTYYILGDHNVITGPMYLQESDDLDHVSRLIAQNKIYVLSRRQLFEVYQKQQSA